MWGHYYGALVLEQYKYIYVYIYMSGAPWIYCTGCPIEIATTKTKWFTFFTPSTSEYTYWHETI